MNGKILFVAGCVMALLLTAGVAMGADVFNMPSGLTSLEFVTVGNPGNRGELSGVGAGGTGPDRVCGAVDYTFKMGKFEVTAGQYTEFLNAVAKTDTYWLYKTNMWSDTLGCKIKRSGLSGSFRYSVTADYANRPVNYVSWGDAARFVNWLTNGQPMGAQDLTTTEDGSYFLNGAWTDDELTVVTRIADANRLQGKQYYFIPSEDEWYKAAYHKNDGVTGNYFDYPTGSNTVPGRDVTDFSGNNANYYGSPYPLDSDKYTTLVGEFQNSESPYGTFDQGGNVWEWNESILYGDHRRGLRGGSFEEYRYGSKLLASYRDGDIYYYVSTSESCGLGFRISEVPEPASVGLLLVGGLVLIRRRRVEKRMGAVNKKGIENVQ